MLRLSLCLLVLLSNCRGQIVPRYGSTPGPFNPLSTAITPTIASTLPTGGPFNPSPRPFLPPGYNNPYNNPYYNPNPTAGPAIPILSYSNDHAGDGTYSYSYSSADGKQAQESGYLKDAYIDNAGEPQGTQVVQGSYAYIAPDGTPIQVNYVADENGFRPTGIHIPADGKGLAPPAVIDGKDNRVLDPFNRFNNYNRYDPYNYRNNQYNNGYNNKLYDPRYSQFNNRYNQFIPLNNSYRPALPYGPPNNAIKKDISKKD